MFVASYLTEIDHEGIVQGGNGMSVTELCYGFTCAVSPSHALVLEAALSKLAVEMGDIFEIPADELRASFALECTSTTSEYGCEYWVTMGLGTDVSAAVVIQQIEEI